MYLIPIEGVSMMFRKLFQSSPAGVEIADLHEESLDALAGNINRSQTRDAESAPRSVGLGKFESFDEIYRSGPANQPTLAYDIMKVAQMLESPHIASLSAESKRGSLMMALEAANVEPKDIMQDAMVRQR